MGDVCEEEQTSIRGTVGMIVKTDNHFKKNHYHRHQPCISSSLRKRSRVPPVRRVGGGRRRSFPHFLPDTARQMLEQGFMGSGSQNHSSVGNIWDIPNLRSSGQYVALIKKIKEHLLSHLINVLI